MKANVVVRVRVRREPLRDRVCPSKFIVHRCTDPGIGSLGWVARGPLVVGGTSWSWHRTWEAAWRAACGEAEYAATRRLLDDLCITYTPPTTNTERSAR